MRSTTTLTRLKQWFGLHKRPQASSRVLVSVYVQPKSMPARSLSRSSRRILLTTSIWSIIVLVFIVFITYTVLIVSVDRPLQKSLAHGHTLDSQNVRKPKLKFHGRGMETKDSSVSTSSFQHQTALWNPGELDDTDSDLPRCYRGSLFIILITSSPDHFEHRKEIRNTWCSPSLYSHEDSRWQCVFLIGQTNNSETVSALRQEARSYEDILRGSYLDSYRNLTHKVMHGLSWVNSRCEAPYVLKTDDDCFVNTILLKQFLLHHNAQTTQLYAGSMVLRKEKRKVIRTPNEKWSVSTEDYQPEYYPIYASGSGYTLSFDVVSSIVHASKYIKPIPNEDAYIGIVVEYLGLKPTLSGRFTLTGSGLRLCNYLYVFVVHGVAPTMHRDMHKKMMMAQAECRSKGDTTDWY